MKRIFVVLLISILIINLIGCQMKKENNSQSIDSGKVSSQTAESKVKGTDNGNIEGLQDSNAFKGKMVLLPEGMEIPKGAEKMPVEGLTGNTVFIPEGIPVPEGAEVLFDTNDTTVLTDSEEANGNVIITKEQKDKLREIFPQLCRETKETLIDNAHLIDPMFDMKKMQILLISNTLHTAYLINSQDKKYGEKDEMVEYSTDTFKDKRILVQIYNIVEFNNKPTYIVNVDYMIGIAFDLNSMKTEIFKFIVHEAVHLVLQKAKDKNLTTMEEAMGRSRAVKYPMEYQSRIYRNQMTHFYKQALSTVDEQEKINNIKKANYFYKKYLEQSEDNKEKSSYDKIEGEARFAEYKALSILEGNKTVDEVNKNAVKLLNKDMNIRILGMKENMEYYIIGSAAYGLIYDLGIENNLDYNNPVKYLLKKYGVTENEGNKKLTMKITNEYEAYNKNIKTRVEDIENKLQSNDYNIIVIPINNKYTENRNVVYNKESLQYEYKNKKVTIDSMSKEIRLGNGRILLKNAQVLSESLISEQLTKKNKEVIEGNESSKEQEIPNGISDIVIENIYVTVPKKDVDIDNSRLSVQTKQVQIYDAKFNEKDGMYYLEDK
ncbi:hypothetical protein [Vallitalea sp.]|jgi:hypothetical protein|uniref:hypothetical protein n=1 Tax=Vallitalea sp. TaxID=1882829 RepID=UPI0025D84487|nr:hypothetical protein [Vallitalea sp.]MCT4687882.1 hypothetical protein [Vallitalea sp.]